MTCSGEAGSVREACKAVAETQHDVILMDLRLGHGEGLDLIAVVDDEPRRFPVGIGGDDGGERPATETQWPQIDRLRARKSGPRHWGQGA